MNKIDFKNALMSTIVDYISEQVILRYMDACKSATVLFTGALIGYADAVESLKALKEDGWKLTAVLSKSAGDVLTADKIKNDIEPDAIYVEGAPFNGRQIVDDSQIVIVPTLTINTAAKVANAICDNTITNMIARAMYTGKSIVAAIDGCCPDNKVRDQMGFKVTEAYKVKLRQNLADLVTYGIVLTTDQNLSQKVEEVYTAGFEFPFEASSDDAKKEAAEDECTCASCNAEVPSGSTRLDKKVIGRMDVAKYAGCAKIVVNKDALITQLAKDCARERGIAIVRE